MKVKEEAFAKRVCCQRGIDKKPVRLVNRVSRLFQRVARHTANGLNGAVPYRCSSRPQGLESVVRLAQEKEVNG